MSVRSTRSKCSTVVQGCDDLEGELRRKKVQERAASEAKAAADNDAKAFQFSLAGAVLLVNDRCDLKAEMVDAKPNDRLGQYAARIRRELVHKFGDKVVIKEWPSSCWVGRTSLRSPVDCLNFSLKQMDIGQGTVVRFVFGIKRDWFREGAPAVAPS